MAHQVRIDAERGVVRVEIKGVLSVEHIEPIATEARAAANRSGLPLLYDVREATQGTVQQTDIFWIPRKIPTLTSLEARRVRVAMVHANDECPIVTFWETVFRNVGFTVQAFNDEALAIAWLAG